MAPAAPIGGVKKPELCAVPGSSFRLPVAFSVGPMKPRNPVTGAMGSPAEMKSYIQKHCDADLSFLFSENEVEVELQYKIVFGGYKTLRRFVGFAESRASFRADAAAAFTLADDPAGKLQMAILVSMWAMAHEQLAREMQVRAETKALRQPRPISQQESLAMRRAIELQNGKLGDHEVPSMAYISDKLEELELNNPQASPMDEILSLDDLEEQAIQPNFDSGGRLLIVRKKTKVRMPSGPEELRLRLRVEAHLWLFLAAKYANKVWLDGLSMATFFKYTEFILGKEVMLLDPDNPIAGSSPEWTVLLAFEHRCRKHAFALVREEGTPLVEALAAACKDVQLKNLHFMSPLLLRSRNKKRDDPPPPRDPNLPPRLTKKQRREKALAAKGAGKGDGGKGGKGARGKGGGKGDSDLASETPDGRKICYGYNKPSGCTRPNCDMVHVCRRRGCFAEHPLFQHPP